MKIREYLKPDEPIRWFSFTGWIILYLFGLEGISGTLLLLYYRPTVFEAYESIRQITYTLNYGWLIRGIHIWGTHLLLAALLLHLTHRLIGYSPALKFTWICGVLAIVLVGLLGITGDLLPWTQVSYWATSFVTQMVTALPYLGQTLKILIRGGNEVSQITLSRFFALHILIFPLIFTSLAGYHIFSVKKSLMPTDLLFQVLILLVLLAVLFSLSTFFPPHLHPKADPFKSVLNIKPEWYFLASYETFHLLYKTPLTLRNSVILGISLHLAVFLLLPFLGSSSDKKRRGLKLSLSVFGLLVFAALTILGVWL